MFDEARAERRDNPILAEFYQNTTSLKQEVIDFLVKRHGIPNLALAYDSDGTLSVIGAANVAFEGKLFDFADPNGDSAVKALIIVARDRCGDPRDLIAWCPRGDRVASHMGRVALLGAHQINGPKLSGPLRAHRGMLGWLRAGRAGVVIFDPRRAWRELEGTQVQADDIEHGTELQRLLSAPAPRIFVPAAIQSAAA